MSQETCYKYLVKKEGKWKTTKQVAKACNINEESAAVNLKKLYRIKWIHRKEGKSLHRRGQIGYFWMYNGLEPATDE